MIRVVDHTEPGWAARYSRHGRENGAATYSRDIVNHHLPAWRDRLAELGVTDATISTCPLMTDGDHSGELAIQYLHTYPYSDPVNLIRQAAEHLHARFDRVVFVAAYRAMTIRLAAAGFDAFYLPMTVDVERIRQHRADKPLTGRAVYFGNVMPAKIAEYKQIAAAVQNAGLRLDTISDSTFNGQPISQESAWRLMSRYPLGIGVGRCALEMFALGVPVVLSGAKFGGLVTTDAEHETQTASNFNGRVMTFDRNRAACIESAGTSIIRANDLPVMWERIAQFR